MESTFQKTVQILSQMAFHRMALTMTTTVEMLVTGAMSTMMIEHDAGLEMIIGDKVHRQISTTDGNDHEVELHKIAAIKVGEDAAEVGLGGAEAGVQRIATTHTVLVAEIATHEAVAIDTARVRVHHDRDGVAETGNEVEVGNKAS